MHAYYNELVSIFQKIDARIQIQQDNVNGVVTLHKTMTCLRTHIFLVGLDFELNNARSEILHKDPPLDLETSYAFMRRDYNQRHTMEEKKFVSENSALLTTRHRQLSIKGKASGKGHTYTCTHCRESGHSKE